MTTTAASEDEMVRVLPSPALREHVLWYTGFRERTSEPIRRRELPFGGVAVILALDHTWWIGDEADGRLTEFRSFAGGLIDAPVLSEHSGRAFTLQFNLRPLGARALFGVPGRELTGRVVALEDLLGPEEGRLVERLALAPDWPSRFAVLDAFLTRRILAAPAVSADVQWAWRRLVSSAGRVRIDALTQELGCSRRHLAARFGEDVGMTPKAFARLLRFEHAVTALQSTDEGLGRVAADCGFSDQAHFTRELRAFAGVPPSVLLAQRSGAGFVL